MTGDQLTRKMRRMGRRSRKPTLMETLGGLVDLDTSVDLPWRMKKTPHRQVTVQGALAFDSQVLQHEARRASKRDLIEMRTALECRAKDR